MPNFRCRFFFGVSSRRNAHFWKKCSGVDFWARFLEWSKKWIFLTSKFAFRLDETLIFHFLTPKKRKWSNWFLRKRCWRCCYKVDIFGFQQNGFFGDFCFRLLAHESLKKWFWSSSKVILEVRKGPQSDFGALKKWFWSSKQWDQKLQLQNTKKATVIVTARR